MTQRAVLAVFDSAVQAYGQPIFVAHVGAGVRSFQDEVQRPAQDNSLHMHSEDYHLSHIADYDEETGAFTVPREGVRVLIRGKDVPKKEHQA
ncbi:MAG: nonstructural protein [Microviridae sp.]|nr:MAG: nonstructural protein [Microviridae sp.]